MSDFSLISVIISIFIALALSKILESWGIIIQLKKTFKSTILYLLVSLWLFLFLIAHWLGISAYHDLEYKSYGISFFMFLPSIIGTLATYILVPRIEPNQNLESSYFNLTSRSHLIIGIFVISAGITDLLIPENKPAPLFVFLLIGGLFILLSRFQNWLFHFLTLVSLLLVSVFLIISM